MRALLVSDVEAKQFYDYYTPGKLKEFDIIISCGDLSKEYLEFLVTMASCPVLYVRGNHDDSLIFDPPEGCICIEDSVYEYQGVRFLGLGGSAKYNGQTKDQYTENEMKMRIMKMKMKLKLRKGFDVLVTHAPVYGVGDLDTAAHKGFECFGKLVEQYNPSYVFHGHVHMNYSRNERIREYKGAKVINAYEFYIEDIDIKDKSNVIE